jgi:hypothetical protein
MRIKQRRKTMENGKHFKVNLPDTEEGYRNGNGEGCWAWTDDPDVIRKWEDDYTSAPGETFDVRLDNDSWYWHGLEHGTTVPIEMRGDKRPVVPLAWLQERYACCQ